MGKPINELVKMSEEIAKGNLNYRTKLSEINEISTLSIQMNAMADNLNVLLEENTKK